MATPTTISKQKKPAASKPMAHKASLTSHAQTLEPLGLGCSLGVVSGVVSFWGIGLGWATPSE